MKKLILSLIILSVATALTSFYPAPDTVSVKKPIQTIIIDAGHGGRDPGCRGSYSFEKDIALDIALKLGKQMEEEFPDVKVLYTRTTDTYPPNRSRAEFANNNKGDLYISIHVNSMPKKKHTKFAGYKTEVYYTGKGKKGKNIPAVFLNTPLIIPFLQPMAQKLISGPQTAQMKRVIL